MQTKETYQEKTATAADFTKELCALAREHLVGFTGGVSEGEFTFSTPGGVKTFRVRVNEEKGA